MRPILPATLVALLLALPADAERRFEELGVGRGLDAMVVTGLLFDRDGLLWVGSREGLFRYDGYQATAFLPDLERPGHISDVDVRTLYEADDGALWVSTNTGGLNRRDPITGRFQQYHHASGDPRSLSDESVYGVGQDADGTIWVGTQNGLNRLEPDGKGFTRFFHDSGPGPRISDNWVFTVHRGPSGTLWFGTVGGGIDRWDPADQRFENFSIAKLVGGDPEFDDVFAIHERSDGRIWAGTRRGLVVLEPAGRKATVFDLAQDGAAQPLVTTMHADQQGRLWIATLAQGVLVVDVATGQWAPTHPGSVGAPGNLPAQPQLSVTTNGNTLFVGTWGSGVYTAPLEEPSFRLLTSSKDGSGLRWKNVTAVLATEPAGQPWAGSFGGGVQRTDVITGSVTPSGGAANDSFRTAGVSSLAATADGALFAGATAGLYRFGEDGQSVGFDAYSAGKPDGIGEGYVTSLLDGGRRGLWVGLGGSGLFLRDAATGRFRRFQHDADDPDSWSGNVITDIAPDGPDRLWIGTRSDGLNRCRIEPWACERFDGRSGGSRNLAHFHVTALRRDHGGALWVATDGGGVHRVQQDADGRVTGFERWGTARGLLNDGVMAVEEDSDGSLWLSTRHGLSRLDPATGRVANDVAHSGLPAVHFNAGASSSDAGFVHFGSVGGLLSIPKGAPMRSRAPAPVRVTGIERLTTGATRPFPPEALRAGFKAGSGDVIAVEFAVLDFAEATHQYAYRLDPRDAWTPLGQRRQVTFFGLSPGSYRFEVRGRDSFGQWSTSPTLAFRVVPPYWMTLWFRVLAVAGTALLIVGVHVTRLRSLRRRNVELEQLRRGLRQLTGRLESAKEEERARMSRELHDEFGQTLTAAKINLQMLRQSSGDPAAAQRLDDSIQMVDDMIRQARNIALGLRPPLLDEAGLVPAIEHHLKSLADRTGIAIEFHAAPGVTGAPAGLNTKVFRVVQEAVSNALRHAHAATIRVALASEADALTLTVEDDGIGFDPEAVSQRAKRGEHLGLLGMTERVNSAGGTIALDSRPGGGSRISARIPFPSPE